MKITFKKGKGVLGKDNKPYAPGTIHYVADGWLRPRSFTVKSLLNCLQDPGVTRIEIIDEANVETIITIDS